MSDIALNSAVRSNLRSMQATTELMNRTEERLSSGKKVNSALDNPSNFFTSQALDRRSSDLSNLLDSVSNSVQTLKAADNGISAISDLVSQMKSTARSAQQSTSAFESKASVTASTGLSALTADNLLGTVASAAHIGTAATVTGTGKTEAGASTPVTGATLASDLGITASSAITVDGNAVDLTGITDLTSVLTKITTAIGAGATSAIDGTTGAITISGVAAGTNFTIGGADASKLNLTAGATTNGNTTGPVVATNVGTALGVPGAATAISTTSNASALGITSSSVLTVNGAAVDFSGITGSSTVADVLTAVKTAIGTGATSSIDATTGAITFTAGDKNTPIQFGGAAATNLGVDTTNHPADPDVAAGAYSGGLNAQTLTLQVGTGKTLTVTFGATTDTDTSDNTAQVSTLSDLNSVLKQFGGSASLSSDGKLTIASANASESKDLKIGGTIMQTGGALAGGKNNAGATVAAVSAGATATASAVADDSNKKARTDYKNDYNDLLDQVKTLAKDASYNGVNLLSGDDLKVVFNEDGSSSLDIGGTNVMDTLGLSSLTGDEFLDSANLDDVVTKLNSALSGLDSLSSRFGSQLSVVQTRQDFTKSMIGTLDDGSNSLTAADTNEEAANLATLQTRQSLIVSSLSISTSQEQNILQLLR
jgi:flagellin-like hook-associated protein FlgL